MKADAATVDGGLPWLGNSRETIDLVGKLWDIECRHLLGKLTRAEYRRTVVALRGDSVKWRSPAANSRKKIGD
ncbi:hypothetical protein [Quatrionicoccus australiensis]|uniref:hypothetical protein n=1 Tax=Quatrionicoccus australiensis TaxID=138118 RepID=UPI001CF96E60|nr:hypothetical protein [Quatrionicoccus australiensis]MCB4359074.1 hypothetical protein [Quatrionicoccus australiensis]